MPYVVTTPEAMASVAVDINGVGTAITSAYGAAAQSTVGIVPAAADEVSAAIAQAFSQLGADSQVLGHKAREFYDAFTARLHAGAIAYVDRESASVAHMATSIGGPYALAPTGIAGRFLVSLWYAVTNAITAIATLFYATLSALVSSLYLSFSWTFFFMQLLNNLVATQLYYMTGVTPPLALPF